MGSEPTPICGPPKRRSGTWCSLTISPNGSYVCKIPGIRGWFFLESGFLLHPITPESTLKFEEELGQFARELARQVVEWTVNNAEPESDADQPHDLWVNSAGYRRTTSRNDEASIMIDNRPEPTPLEQYSPLFQSIQEGYADGSIEVYAPVDWETRAERRRFREKLHEPIRSEIESITKEVLRQEIQQAEQAEGIGA